MILRTKSILALAALFSLVLANGFHIAALQGLGYLRMFNEYHKTMSVEEALELTFSGREMCGICAAVDEIQAEMDQTLEAFAQQCGQMNLLVPSSEALALRTVAKRSGRMPPDVQEPDAASRPVATPPPRNVVA